MNLEAINKWLDEEYGCSYTRLLELHDFYFEKYCDLKQENKHLKEVIDKLNKYLSESQLTRSVKGTRIYDGINANYEIRNILKEVE